MLLRTAIVIGSVGAIIGGYVHWQYRTARPPALDTIPGYFAKAAVPVTDIPGTQRAGAEAQLRKLASSAQPGYRVADERFLATEGPLIWDAMRHHIRPHLESLGYASDADGSSADNTIVYSVYKHEGWLRPRFNDDLILVAGLDHTAMQKAAGNEIHLYGYFRLTPA